MSDDDQQERNGHEETADPPVDVPERRCCAVDYVGRQVVAQRWSR